MNTKDIIYLASYTICVFNLGALFTIKGDFIYSIMAELSIILIFAIAILLKKRAEVKK